MTSDDALKHTPLHALHVELGARMVPFAGYEMPVHYKLGVLKEHLHTRAAAGLFDVSHMGQIVVQAKSGDAQIAARALERLVPVDILGLAPGRLRYAFFTNANGGILDDVMVAICGGQLLCVVNAACKAADEAHLRAELGKECQVEPLDRALIALQGPKAKSALALLAPECSNMRFMDVRMLTLMGAECMVARSGYTGEDGFEISIPTDVAREIAEELLANADVAPVGLGARDSLRLEAGLCLYGSGRSGVVLGHPEGAPPGRSARERFSRGQNHSWAARVWCISPSRRAQAGGAGTRACRRVSLCGDGRNPACRFRDFGWLWSQP